MSDRPMAGGRPLDDAALEASLRGLTDTIDWPTAAPTGGPDVATMVRVRLVERAAEPRRPRAWALPRRRTLPRAVALALVALLALAAIAAALGLGLPGLRIVLGDPPSPPPSAAPVPSAVPGPPGSTLGLGRVVTLEEARALSRRPLALPSDPTIGQPDAIWVDAARGAQIAMVWAATPDLPATTDPGIGLVLMTFDGSIDPGYFTKIIGSGTVVERIRVDGRPGYWIEGDPHFFFYESSAGVVVEDSRRWVGDALLWSDGSTTYRLETSAGRAAALEIATSLE